jgi:PST family polysaccharide transporter
VDRPPPQEGAHDQHFRTDHLLTDLRGRTVSSGVITGIAQGTLFFLNLGTTMVLARLLLPKDFGLVAMVTTELGFFRVFKDAGLSTATVQREGITHAQVSNLFWINVALSGFVTLVFAISAPVLAWFYREPGLFKVTLGLSVTFLLAGATVQHSALLNRQMRFKALAAVQVISAVAGAAVGIGMAWSGWRYWSLVGSNLVVALSTCVLTWAASRWVPQMPTFRSGTRPLVSFGAKLASAGFIWSIARGTDSLFLGRFRGADAVGLYTRAATLLMRPLDQLMYPIESVFVPALARLQLQPERYRRTFLQGYEAIALITFFGTSVFLALAQPITLVVLGPKWEKAAVIFAAFTTCALFYPLSCAATWLFASQGRGHDWLWSSVIVSCATVAAFLIGVQFGAASVAIAYSISGFCVQMPVLFHLAGRVGPVTRADLWSVFFRYLPVWAVVCGATALVDHFVANLAPLVRLLICCPAGFLVGIGFIWLYAPTRRTALNLIGIVRDRKSAKGVAVPNPVPAA